MVDDERFMMMRVATGGSTFRWGLDRRGELGRRGEGEGGELAWGPKRYPNDTELNVARCNSAFLTLPTIDHSSVLNGPQEVSITSAQV